ncbi:hypothetical protein GGS24DRAFT_257430 [Hypoxylon argillaceum]|nr:hypothetical protein GGS24DRAFT_257430 [Hypoxylon argillaceum]
MDQDHIDGLLERYLHLLHEYTTLREELTALQTSMYQNIARANFAAERGLRFGQDHYDDRMQASRRLAISCQGPDQAQEEQSASQDRRNPLPTFTVINPASAATAAALAAEDSESSNPSPPPPHPKAETEAESDSVGQGATTHADGDAQPRENDKAALGERSAGVSPKKGIPTTPQKQHDPLRWFGLLTPVPLRQAQAQSIRAVEHVIPRLASVDAEMVEVEIEVRRARKRREKAKKAAETMAAATAS